MLNLDSLDRKQQTVVWSATAAVIFSITFVLITYFFLPLSLPLLDTQEQRLFFTLRCQIFPALMLIAGIVAVGNARFTSAAIDPLSDAESESTRVHLSYLNNTLEQFVLFLIASLVLSTFLDAHSVKLIPILTILFVLGRIAFWFGYLQDPLKRAFGMGVTLYPTFVVLLYDAYRILVLVLGLGI